MRLATFLAVLVLAAGVAVAEDKQDKQDKLILKDGQVITGRIMAESETDIEVLDGKEKIKVPTWAVDKIERSGVTAGATEQSAAGSKPRSRPQRFESTPALTAWIDLCVKNLGSDDLGVQTSAAAALRSAGPAATPALQKMAGGADKGLAERAQEVLAGSKLPARGREARRGDGTTKTAQHQVRNEALAKDLGLNAEQTPAVDKIFTEYREKALEFSKSVVDGKMTSDDARKSVAALREQRNSKLTAVLTAEQMKKYLATTERPKKTER